MDMNKRQIFKLNNREKNKIISAVSLFVFLFRDFIFVFALFGNLKNEWEKIHVKEWIVRSPIELFSVINLLRIEIWNSIKWTLFYTTIWT